MLQTVNCLNHPDRKAVVWTGHVHDKQGRIIISGWCSSCGHGRQPHLTRVVKKICASTDSAGCDGRWRKEFGAQNG